MHPKSWTNESKIWGAFLCDFQKNDKINMYHMYQKGYGYSEVKEHYPIGQKETFTIWFEY